MHDMKSARGHTLPAWTSNRSEASEEETVCQAVSGMTRSSQSGEFRRYFTVELIKEPATR